jgi:hypothetical protein
LDGSPAPQAQGHQYAVLIHASADDVGDEGIIRCDFLAEQNTVLRTGRILAPEEF